MLTESFADRSQDFDDCLMAVTIPGNTIRGEFSWHQKTSKANGRDEWHQSNNQVLLWRQAVLVESFPEIQASRWLMYSAASRRDQSSPSKNYAERSIEFTSRVIAYISAILDLKNIKTKVLKSKNQTESKNRPSLNSTNAFISFKNRLYWIVEFAVRLFTFESIKQFIFG